MLLVMLPFKTSCKEHNSASEMEAKKNKKVTVIISHKMTNDMIVVIDENGETRSPEPEVSKPDTLTVGVGDQMNSFVVKKITKSSITIKSDYFSYYMSPGDVRGQTFTIQRGDSVSLTMMDLMDATSTTYIKVLP